MRTAKLVVLGSINADHILNIDQFPQPGETVTGHHYQLAFGGKGSKPGGCCWAQWRRHLIYCLCWAR